MESSLPPFGHVPPSAVEAAAAFSESEFRKRGTLASVQPRTDASGMASYFHLTDSKKPPLRRAAKSRLQDCARARAASKTADDDRYVTVRDQSFLDAKELTSRVFGVYLNGMRHPECQTHRARTRLRRGPEARIAHRQRFSQWRLIRALQTSFRAPPLLLL